MTGKPVQIVCTNEKKLHLFQNRLTEILLDEKVKDKPCFILSVAGEFRTGKSFLLNFFIRYLEKTDEWLNVDCDNLKGFSWSGGPSSNTDGILLWDKPFFLLDEMGNEVVLFLMDTQGTHCTERPLINSVAIFSLSTFISSFQIFNISTQITLKTWQDLEYFCRFGECFVENVENEEKPYEQIMILIRDWENGSTYPYGSNGGCKYVQERLAVVPDLPSINQTREAIKNCFKKIYGFLTPYPGEKIASDSCMVARIEDMEDVFKKSLKALTEFLFDSKKLKPKTVDGKPATSEKTFEIIRNFVNSFNTGNHPEVRTMTEVCGRYQLITLNDGLKKYYNNEMEKILLKSKGLFSKHVGEEEKELKAIILRKYDEAVTMADKPTKEEYRAKLLNKLGSTYKKYHEKEVEKRGRSREIGKFILYGGLALTGVGLTVCSVVFGGPVCAALGLAYAAQGVIAGAVGVGVAAGGGMLATAGGIYGVAKNKLWNLFQWNREKEKKD